MDTSYSLEMCRRLSTLVIRSRENDHSSSECHRWSPVMFGCSCSRQVMDWLTARENGGIVFLLFGAEKCTTGIPWYHWSGRRRHCWWGRTKSGNRPSLSFKSDSLSDTGKWEREKFCSREVTQAADGSMRVGQPAYIKSLDFVPLGKLRKEQSGDASEVDSCHEIGAWSSWVFST